MRKKRDNLKGKTAAEASRMWDDLTLEERDVVIDHVDDALSEFNRGMAELAEDLKNGGLRK